MTNVTALNTTVIDPGDLAYVPFEVWLVLFILTFIFFFHAIMARNNTDSHDSAGDTKTLLQLACLVKEDC